LSETSRRLATPHTRTVDLVGLSFVWLAA